MSRFAMSDEKPPIKVNVISPTHAMQVRSDSVDSQDEESTS